jgi:hypothetical protein
MAISFHQLYGMVGFGRVSVNLPVSSLYDLSRLGPILCATGMCSEENRIKLSVALLFGVTLVITAYR